MASTYSSLKIELIGTGEQSGTWGTTTNTNLGTAIEEAITGSADVTFASADVTLTLTDSNASQTARNLRLNLIGTSGGARNLIVPAIEKQYIVNNGLADAVTIKNSTGTGIAIPAGKSMIVFNNGTNVVEAITYSSLFVYPSAGIANSTGSAWGTSYSTSGSGTVVALATGASLTTPVINTNASVGGTWTAAATWTLPAYTLGGTVSGGGNTINNVVISATSESNSGNYTFTGTANRITGDFSNATISDRVSFQSSTSNGNTVVGALPNGTATGSSFQVYNNATPTNSSLGSFEASSSLVTLASSIRGSGTYLPLSFNVNGAETVRILTSGAISFGSSGTAYGTTGQLLQSNGNAPPTWVAAPTGAVANGTMYENNTTITSNYTLTTNKNAMSVGPITISSGVAVTVPSGQRWVVL